MPGEVLRIIVWQSADSKLFGKCLIRMVVTTMVVMIKVVIMVIMGTMVIVVMIVVLPLLSLRCNT